MLLPMYSYTAPALTPASINTRSPVASAKVSVDSLVERFAPTEPSSSQPILLCASATPIDAATPPALPTPIAAEAPTTVASIDASLFASISTSRALVTVLPSISALVCVVMVLAESAPAPLRATPTPLERPAATEAATATLEIVVSFNQREVSE